MRSKVVATLWGLALAVGCAAASSDAPPAGAGGGRGGASGTQDEAVVGTGGATAMHAGAGGAAATKTIVQVEGEPYRPKPCAEICAAAGATCVVKCTDVGFTHRDPGPLAAWAMYSSTTTSESGNRLTVSDDRYLASCSTAFEPTCGMTFSTSTPWECPPGDLSQSGKPFTLDSFRCCCEK
jgi:hypothetical protein